MKTQDRFNLQLSVLAISLSCAALLLFSSCSRQQIYPSPSLKGPDVTVDVRALRPETPAFFTYEYRGKHINFFVVKINNTTHAFLDACASCYPRKLGYSFERGYLRCRACNMEYTVAGIERGFGGCMPIRLKGSLKKGEYTIPVSMLEGMADKF